LTITTGLTNLTETCLAGISYKILSMYEESVRHAVTLQERLCWPDSAMLQSYRMLETDQHRAANCRRISSFLVICYASTKFNANQLNK
jgi:hypothetical protein